jgi:agmatine/peptidylarginine deiminase
MISPKNDGYSFPFEGLAHGGTIIFLPYREDTWEDGGLKAFPEFKSIIETISTL